VCVCVCVCVCVWKVEVLWVGKKKKNNMTNGGIDVVGVAGVQKYNKLGGHTHTHHETRSVHRFVYSPHRCWGEPD